MALAMREDGFTKPERSEGEHRRTAFTTTLKDGVGQVRAHHVLLLILAVAALHGASTEGFDRLSDYHLLRDLGLPSLGNLDPVVWFGILDGVSMVLGIVALSVVKRRAHLEGHAAVAKILMGIDALLIVSVVVFGLAGQFWMALLAFWVVGALRTVRDPVFTAWINQGLDPKTRATINSMGSQADAVGQAAGGPVLGAGRHEGLDPGGAGHLRAAEPAGDRALHPRDPTRFGGHAEARRDGVRDPDRRRGRDRGRGTGRAAHTVRGVMAYGDAGGTSMTR